MATATPLTHPVMQDQCAAFYAYRATFTSLSDDGEPVEVSSIEADRPCAYMPAGGGPIEGFEVQQETKDRILIPGWFPQIGTKWEVTLKIAATDEQFGIFVSDDVMPNDSSQSATLLNVSPA